MTASTSDISGADIADVVFPSFIRSLLLHLVLDGWCTQLDAADPCAEAKKSRRSARTASGDARPGRADTRARVRDR